MDEPKGQATRRMQESTKEAAKAVNQLAEKGAQASAALTEANQRVIAELVSLSMETAQESGRLFLQLQQSTMDMMRESQAAALRCQMVWPEVFKDPMRWYQNVCQEGMEGARKAFGAVNGTSEAVTDSVGRLQASTQQAGTKIEQALSTAASRMKEVV